MFDLTHYNATHVISLLLSMIHNVRIKDLGPYTYHPYCRTGTATHFAFSSFSFQVKTFLPSFPHIMAFSERLMPSGKLGSSFMRAILMKEMGKLSGGQQTGMIALYFQFS